MGQSDGMGGTLRRIALKVGDSGWYNFRVNPAQYNHSKPQRVTIFKTKSNIITEDFGKDIETIQFSGTTGFRRDSNGKTGKDRLMELEAFIDSYANQGGNGNRSKTEMTFYNFTDEQYFIVHLAPEGLKVERSVDQPLLYTYTLSLVVLRDAGAPSERDKANPEIGNAKPSVGTSTSGDFRTANTRAYSASVLPQTAVNPAGTQGAYLYGVEELKKLIGYGVN